MKTVFQYQIETTHCTDGFKPCAGEIPPCIKHLIMHRQNDWKSAKLRGKFRKTVERYSIFRPISMAVQYGRNGNSRRSALSQNKSAGFSCAINNHPAGKIIWRNMQSWNPHEVCPILICRGTVRPSAYSVSCIFANQSMHEIRSSSSQMLPSPPRAFSCMVATSFTSGIAFDGQAEYFTSFITGMSYFPSPT